MERIPPMFVVQWRDSAAGRIDWEFRDELEPLRTPICNSVGFVITESESELTLAAAVSDTQVWGQMTILKSSIISRERVYADRPKKARSKTPK